jgi:Glycosyl hydrolase family 3 N terminal domain
MSDMDLATIGQHFIIGLRPDTTLDERDRLLLRDLRPAGVILYKSNFHHDRPYDAWLSSQAELISAIEEMGFNGVIVSDDIGMRAIRPMFEDPDAAVRFVAAGNDMIMISAHWTDTAHARSLARSIIAARRSGTLPGRILERAHERIETMLADTRQHEARVLSAETLLRHSRAGAVFSEKTVEVT